MALNGIPEDLNTDELSAIPVCRREIKLIMHNTHPLAQYDRVPLKKLDKENVSMLYSPGVMEQLLERTFTASGIQPNVVSQHSQIHGMLEMVLTGCSVGFVNLAPEATAMEKYEDLVLRSFEQPIEFMVGFMMKRKKYLPPICKELISFISEALGSKPPRR